MLVKLLVQGFCNWSSCINRVVKVHLEQFHLAQVSVFFFIHLSPSQILINLSFVIIFSNIMHQQNQDIPDLFS